MFAPTQTLLHTYNHHDDDDDDDDDDHHHHRRRHHHHHIIIRSSSHHHHHHQHHHRHHHHHHHHIKIRHPSEQYVDWGNNINFIFTRGQNSPPPLNNILIGVITSTINIYIYIHEGSTFATPYEQYVGWGNNIHFI